MSLLFILAALPVVVILIYIYRKDVNKEPKKQLFKAFLAGCFTVIPASIMEIMLGPFTPSSPVLGGMFEGFVVAAFSEELWKLLLFMVFIWSSRHFDEYFDGIIYAVYISMGFACIENFMYVFSPDNFIESYSTAAVRAIVSVPGHFLFAVAMGYYLSLAKFDRAKRSSHLFMALLAPVTLHGTFDAILMVSERLSQHHAELNFIVGGLELVIFIIFDIRMWRKGLRRIRQMQDKSHEQDFDPMNPFENFQWDV